MRVGKQESYIQIGQINKKMEGPLARAHPYVQDSTKHAHMHARTHAHAKHTRTQKTYVLVLLEAVLAKEGAEHVRAAML